MVIFEKLTARNFRSFGDNKTVFNFKNGFDLLNGKNQAGKSSLMYAIIYSLFGKIRGIKNDEIINNINKSECVLIIEFSKKKDKYKIVRGLRPKIFEIYKNNTLIDQTSTVQQYQEMLENDILEINYQGFNNLISLDNNLSSKNYMTMNAIERREFLEYILNLKILYLINKVAKIRLHSLKTKITEYNYKLQSRKTSLETEIKSLEKIKKVNKELTENNIEKINEYELKIKDKEAKEVEYKKGFELISKAEKDVKIFKNDVKELEFSFKKLKQTYQQLSTEIQYKKQLNNTYISCIGCDNLSKIVDKEIDESHILKQESLLNELNLEINNIRDILNSKQVKLNKSEKIIGNKTRVKINYKNLLDEINEIKIEIDKLKNYKMLEEDNTKIISLNSQIEEIESNLDDFVTEESKLNNIIKVTSDSSLKQQLFKKYIPILKKYTNEYLSEFELDYTILFDENFNVTIKDRGEERSYLTFSASERSRINFSVIFAFLKLIENKNSFKINLLILDEILDTSGLSPENFNLVLQFIKNKISNKNIILISHKFDLNHEVFDRIFSIEKKTNFSSLIKVQ